jgi:hypothetical protein
MLTATLRQESNLPEGLLGGDWQANVKPVWVRILGRADPCALAPPRLISRRRLGDSIPDTTAGHWHDIIWNLRLATICNPQAVHLDRMGKIVRTGMLHRDWYYVPVRTVP